LKSAILHASETTMKEFNPNWPFPQYDEDGNRLLPLGWQDKPTAAQRAQELADEVGEALL
jgi:hypothetical protein